MGRRFPRETTGDPWDLKYTFAGATADNQVLEYSPPTAWPNVRYIRVDTVDSPSWVAWKETRSTGPRGWAFRAPPPSIEYPE